MHVIPCISHPDHTLSTSTGIEIIEVNGAVFYRKRKATPTPPAATPPAAKRVCGDGGGDRASEAVVGPEGETRENSQGSLGVASAADGDRAAAEQPPADPLDVLQKQLEACLPASCPKAISVQVQSHPSQL